MPPEIWVVGGWDQYGDNFTWPNLGTASSSDLFRATREEDERTASRLNRLGGIVSVHREVWNAPAAAYRRVV